MSQQRPLASKRLPLLARGLSPDVLGRSQAGQALKVFFYRDVLHLKEAGALPNGIARAAWKAFLHGSGKRTAYLNAIARGLGRIDLTGTVVTTTIPADRRQRAQAEATVTTDMPSAPAPAAPTAPTVPTPAPVTVPTGAGTATVTKRTPLGVKPKAATQGPPGWPPAGLRGIDPRASRKS